MISEADIPLSNTLSELPKDVPWRLDLKFLREETETKRRHATMQAGHQSGAGSLTSGDRRRVETSSRQRLALMDPMVCPRAIIMGINATGGI